MISLNSLKAACILQRTQITANLKNVSFCLVFFLFLYSYGFTLSIIVLIAPWKKGILNFELINSFIDNTSEIKKGGLIDLIKYGQNDVF